MRKLGDTDVLNKTVALRVDLNVPVNIAFVQGLEGWFVEGSTPQKTDFAHPPPSLALPPSQKVS